MPINGTLIFETETNYSFLQVWDVTYTGRPARVLYSGNAQAAQSGIALDDDPTLLFDYNQRFLEIVKGMSASRILLIGGGMFTLPMALLAEMPNIYIDVVEIDDALISIAKRYFHFKSNSRLRVVHNDGLKFLKATIKNYDIILVDAFSHTTIPESITNSTAITAMKQRLSPSGMVAVNVISAYKGRGADIISDLTNTFRSAFQYIDIFPASRSLSLWLPQNLILVAQPDLYYPVENLLLYPPLNYDDIG